MFQVNNKDTRTTPMANDVILVSLFAKFEHIPHLTSIANLEQINAGWAKT